MGPAVGLADVTILAVGTPHTESGIDLSALRAAAADVGRALKGSSGYRVVCVKSTAIPRTTEDVVAPLIRNESCRGADEIGVCMVPEFLREGCAVEDFMNPDRIVIGAEDDRSYAVIRELHAFFSEAAFVRTNPRTAEMIKYANNAFYASLISFSNEIANICEIVVGVDIEDVLEGVALDKRLSPKIGAERIHPQVLAYLRAGCGFGGSCFPKDVRSLADFAAQKGYQTRMLRATMAVNDDRSNRIIGRIEVALGGMRGKKVAVLGTAFKPDTDDVRESPAFPIIASLLREGADVWVTDPIALPNARKAGLGSAVIVENLHEALAGADACILVTKWKQYVDLRPSDFVSLMKNPCVFDGRRVYDVTAMRNAGVRYFAIGLVEKD